MCVEYASRSVEAKYVKIAMSEFTVSLVELVEGCGLVRLQLGDDPFLHRFGLGGGAERRLLRDGIVGQRESGTQQRRCKNHCTTLIHDSPPLVTQQGEHRWLSQQTSIDFREYSPPVGTKSAFDWHD